MQWLVIKGRMGKTGRLNDIIKKQKNEKPLEEIVTLSLSSKKLLLSLMLGRVNSPYSIIPLLGVFPPLFRLIDPALFTLPV